MAHAFRFLHKSETPGDYYEFGVFQGRSLATAHKIHRQLEQRPRHFYAFDSFAGLPAFTNEDEMPDYEVFHEGQFATSEEQVAANLANNGVDIAKVTLVAGFYEDSLKRSDTASIVGDSKAALVHVDCDLYSSTVPCLTFVQDRLVDGAILMFDDWFCYRGRPDRGVRRAFEEWRETVPYTFTEYCKYTWSGKMFICNTLGDEKD